MTGIEVKYLWHDTDVTELRICAANQKFLGTADVYIGTGSLSDTLSRLKGFPQSPKDAREVVLGGFGRESAGGAVRLNMYCIDMAGHAVVKAVIEAAYGQTGSAECATVIVEFEPAQLDDFMVQIERFETIGHARLKGLQV